MERRLAAILAADAVGYSRFMGLDEEAALAALTERRSIIDQLVETRGGRIFGTAGDSVVTEFPSSVEAARCAVEIQDRLRQVNADPTDERRMVFRIGVNFGDVMLDGGDKFGDGANVAARRQAVRNHPRQSTSLLQKSRDHLASLAAPAPFARRHREVCP